MVAEMRSDGLPGVVRPPLFTVRDDGGFRLSALRKYPASHSTSRQAACIACGHDAQRQLPPTPILRPPAASHHVQGKNLARFACRS